MRKRFEPQLALDSIAIQDVVINIKSRHELPQLLLGLQYIFTTPELNEAVFKVLEEAILSNKKRTGRLGMSLWEILVLGCCRLNLNIDYDSLHDLSNNHKNLRGILGVSTWGSLSTTKLYALQTIKDNVSLLDVETINKISEIVVKSGHELKKKTAEDCIDLEIKADTFVVERNIHFPTDLRLLWDSVRKCIDIVSLIHRDIKIKGWRNYKNNRRKLRNLYLVCARIHKRKGANYLPRLQDKTKDYLYCANCLFEKVNELLENLSERIGQDKLYAQKREELKYYRDMLSKHIDLVERRILKGEKIPHSEKLFSIFEPETEWINKGKEHPNVELGHNTLIATDQFHFILYHKVVVKEQDKDLVIPLGDYFEKHYCENYNLYSISFDRGFWLQLNKEAMQKKFQVVIMPKKGYTNHLDKEEYQSDNYKKYRRKHSAVESNINEIEQGGLDKVSDKGVEGFQKYVALGVLAYNLKRLGKIWMEQKRAVQSKHKRKKSLKAAA